jgi:hypothetical protein
MPRHGCGGDRIRRDFFAVATEGLAMIADIDAMPNDAALIQRLIDEQKITVAQLANRSGFDDKTIYGYLGGRCTLPSLVLRAAFELTRDRRLIQLVAGFVPVYDLKLDSTETPKRTPPSSMPPVCELIPMAVASVKATADALGYIAVITTDGVVDPKSDRFAIDKFNEHAAAAIHDLSRLMAALQPTIQEAAKS